MLRSRILAASTIIVVLGATGARAASEFIGLGYLPGHSSRSEAASISADGSVVVGWDDGFAGTQAFRWTKATGKVGLGYLPGAPFPSSKAYGVSSNGSVIVGVGASDPVGDQAFRWTQSTGMLGSGSPSSAAYGVSADGSVIVGQRMATPIGNEAFRWTQATGIVGLGFLPGATSPQSEATGVSANGSVVVGVSTSVGGMFGSEEAFRWTEATGMVGMGFLPNSGSFPKSTANGVSADGSVVVGVSTSVGSMFGEEAFRWTEATGMIGLGFLSGLPEYRFSRANAVSADGSTIVGKGTKAGGFDAAILWEGDGYPRDLQQALIEEYGLGDALTGWLLSEATGISADGRTIIGYGSHIDGTGFPRSEAWLARLDTNAPVPVPAALPLFVSGLAGLALLARRRRGSA